MQFKLLLTPPKLFLPIFSQSWQLVPIDPVFLNEILGVFLDSSLFLTFLVQFNSKSYRFPPSKYIQKPITFILPHHFQPRISYCHIYTDRNTILIDVLVSALFSQYFLCSAVRGITLKDISMYVAYWVKLCQWLLISLRIKSKSLSWSYII